MNTNAGERRIRFLFGCLLTTAVSQVASGFSLKSPSSLRLVSSRPVLRRSTPSTSSSHQRIRRYMVEDDSSLLEKDTDKNLVDDTQLFEELVSASSSSSSSEQDVAKDLVVTALKDDSATDFVKDESVVVASTAQQQQEKDAAAALAASETVSAILAASEEATLAAEATLIPRDLADSVPLIPKTTTKQPTNDTVSNNVVVASPAIVPSKEVVGEPATVIPDKIDAPGVKKILKFAIPAIGVWLCSPLLSLIDTSAVGLLSGTAQQAALNPAVAVTDYAALLIAFMYTGTTNLIAAAQEKDRGVEGKPRTTKNLIAALQLSGFVGAGLGMILFVFARSLLRAIIGNDAINPEVFTAAMKYVRIRALGMPAAAIIGSSQAACLGMQDIKSPLYVLAAAAIINFFGDMTFVGSTHPWIGGAAGAAWATVFSQFAAVAFFMKWLCNKPKPTPNPKVVNLTNSINELMGTPSSKGKSRREKFRDDLRAFGKSRVSMTSTLTRKMSSLSKRLSVTNKTKKTELETSKEDSFSTRGFLEGKFRGRDFLTPPSKEKVADFAPYLLPVTTTQVGRVSGYVAMSHVVSSSLGTVSMAAQQVIVSLFYCLCPIADSLSLTAQSFLPSIVEKRVSRARANALRETIRNFWKAGAVFGAAMMAAVMCIPILSGFFTSDPAVITLVNSAAPLLLVFFAVHGVMCSSEGALLGQKDLSFLGKMYAAFFFAVPALMLRVKRAALSGKEVGLTAVWKVFLSYQLFRTVVWLVRAMQLQRRADRKVEIAEEASKIL